MADACSAAHMEHVKLVQDIQNSLLAQVILLALYVEPIISVNIAMDTLMALAQHADVLHHTLIIAIVQTSIK